MSVVGLPKGQKFSLFPMNFVTGWPLADILSHVCVLGCCMSYWYISVVLCGDSFWLVGVLCLFLVVVWLLNEIYHSPFNHCCAMARPDSAKTSHTSLPIFFPVLDLEQQIYTTYLNNITSLLLSRDLHTPLASNRLKL